MVAIRRGKRGIHSRGGSRAPSAKYLLLGFMVVLGVLFMIMLRALHSMTVTPSTNVNSQNSVVSNRQNPVTPRTRRDTSSSGADVPVDIQVKPTFANQDIARYEEAHEDHATKPPVPVAPVTKAPSSDHAYDAANLNGQSGQGKVEEIVDEGGKKIYSVEDVINKHGTGPTNLAYVLDVKYDREHEKVEPMYTRTAKMYERKVAEAFDVKEVKTCEVIEDGVSTMDPICKDPERVLLAYNTGGFDRFICGEYVEPWQGVRLEEHCHEPIHLFEQDKIPLDANGFEPIIIKGPKRREETLEDVECEIPCLFDGDKSGDDFYVDGTSWRLIYTDHDPGHFQKLHIEPQNFRKDIYYSTMSLDSDVPLSKYNAEDYNIRNRPAADFHSVMDKAAYLVDTACNAQQSRRSKWYNDLKENYHVDSLGACGHDTDLQEGEELDSPEGRIAVLGKYKFNLAFETGTAKDYMTTILWEALVSGSVPVFVGASNAAKVLPHNSAILASDFSKWSSLTEYVKTVAKNETLWNSYHAWRSDEKEIAKLERRLNFTRTNEKCRICRWVHAKKYGLGFDHEQQIVKEPFLPRKLCVDSSTGLVSKPFREIWTSQSSDTKISPNTDADQTKCSVSFDQPVTNGNGVTITRKVDSHDGVTDLELQQIEGLDGEKVVLRLAIDIQNLEGAYFRDPHILVPTTRKGFSSSITIQDHRSKVTVVTSWRTKIRSPSPGIIDIVVNDDSIPEAIRSHPRRIRFISEDMNAVHDKVSEYYPSSYSKLFIKDFIDPMEYYYISQGGGGDE